MGEKYYDEHIAPKLAVLAKECEEHGMSLLAVVEWEPGETGRTISLREGSGVGIRIANTAASANGNVDALWIAIMRYAREHGHSSMFLHQAGIPEIPSAGMGG